MDYIAVYIDNCDIYICNMSSSTVAKGLMVQAKLFKKVNTDEFESELKKYKDNGYKVCVIASRGVIKDNSFYVYDKIISIIPRDNLYMHIDDFYKNMAWIDGRYTTNNINSIDRICKNKSSNDKLGSYIIMNTFEVCRKTSLVVQEDSIRSIEEFMDTGAIKDILNVIINTDGVLGDKYREAVKRYNNIDSIIIERTKKQLDKEAVYSKLGITKYKTINRLGGIKLECTIIDIAWDNEYKYKRQIVKAGYKICSYKYLDNISIKYIKDCLKVDISKDDIACGKIIDIARRYGVVSDGDYGREKLTNSSIESILSESRASLKSIADKLNCGSIEDDLKALWEKTQSYMTSFLYEAYRNNILVIRFNWRDLLCVDLDKSRDSNSFKQAIDSLLKANGLNYIVRLGFCNICDSIDDSEYIKKILMELIINTL